MKTAEETFEEILEQKFNDLPEGSQTVSATLTIDLMKFYAKHHAIEFAHYIDVELSDYAKSLKPISEHHSDWINK